MKNYIYGAALLLLGGLLAGAVMYQMDEYDQVALVNSAATFTQNAATTRCENGLPVVTLSWQPVNTASTYTIQRKNVPTTAWSSNLDSQIKGGSYEDKRWLPDYGAITHYYRITEVRRRSRIYSNEISVAVPECRGIATSSPMVNVTPPPTPATTTASSTASTTVSTKATTTIIHTKMPSNVKWGAYVGWQSTDMSAFETLVGKKPSYDMVFSHWGNDLNFPTAYNTRIRDQGRTMVLFWEAVDYNRDYFNQPEYSFDAVLSGRLDPYFANFAAGAKAYGGEVILIPFSEFNGNWFPWGVSLGNNSAKFVEAYRYLHKFFVGIPNVKFGWVPNNDSVPNTPQNQFELYYPGADYVDYVGVDGFNFGGSQQQTFTQMFDSPLTRLTQYNKPIFIFSMASADFAGKPAWITDALTVQLYRYPQVAGWLWFNENKERDWRVNSTPASLEAFKSALP
jgi:Glycosyl hydrolase family 26